MTHSTLAIAGGKFLQFTILKIDTIFNFYKPKPPLSKFVDNFWLCEGYKPEQKTERILPTGTLELVINLRQNELLFYDTERHENRYRFSGAIFSGAHGRGFAPAAEAFIIGVHFKPGGAFPFLGLPAGDLADTHVDLETLWGPSAGRLRERPVPAAGRGCAAVRVPGMRGLRKFRRSRRAPGRLPWRPGERRQR